MNIERNVRRLDTHLLPGGSMLIARSLLAAAVLIGTNGVTTAWGQEADRGPAEKAIAFTGTIRDVNKELRKVEVDALGIPLSPNTAVPLTYNVPDSIDISSFKVGDRVEGQMVVRNNLSAVEHLTVVGKAKTPKDKTPGDSARQPT